MCGVKIGDPAARDDHVVKVGPEGFQADEQGRIERHLAALRRRKLRPQTALQELFGLLATAERVVVEVQVELQI